MFKFKFKTDNILRYFCEKGEIYLSKKIDAGRGIVEKFNLANNLLLKRIELDKYILRIIFDGKNLLLIDGSNKGVLYDKESLCELGIIPLEISGSCHYSDKIVVYQGNVYEREYGIYSKQGKEILWLDKEQNALESFGDYLFGQTSFEIHRSEINTGKILWKSDLKSKYPVLADKRGRINFLNIHNELLICGIDSLDKLLAINIDDGTLKWERTTLPSYYQFDHKKKILHALTAAYKCVDPNTGNELDSFNNRDYFDEIGIFSQRGNYAIAGDHLITTDHAKGIIGAFNTVTHKFDWVHKEEGVSFPRANPIKYCEPYLFVHDNKGTLHIFEKE
jgi:hypothetical protein